MTNVILAVGLCLFPFLPPIPRPIGLLPRLCILCHDIFHVFKNFGPKHNYTLKNICFVFKYVVCGGQRCQIPLELELRQLWAASWEPNLGPLQEQCVFFNLNPLCPLRTWEEHRWVLEERKSSWGLWKHICVLPALVMTASAGPALLWNELEKTEASVLGMPVLCKCTRTTHQVLGICYLLAGWGDDYTGDTRVFIC